MKRTALHIIGLIALLGLAACEQKELFLCPPAGNIPVNVIIHWDSVPANQLVLPNNMTVHWYPSVGALLATDMSVYGGQDYLYASIYKAMCLDFKGNSTLAFRSNGTREDFEAYNIRMTGSYNIQVPQLPGGETTVAEAYPYQWYIDSRPQTIDAENLSEKDTLTVHFYPKNVLREFTFLVYDVIGAKYMSRNGGAISGMSGSYFPASGSLADNPSTILFQRVETIQDAQGSSRWTNEEKDLFARKNPDWASPDTLVGWTRDWVTGKFVTFGPLDRSENRFRLTVEAISNANNHFHGAWGYWHGQWEENGVRERSVAAQIDSAMGKNGTLAEQLAWRSRNGGYDIILYNDRRLAVPETEGGGGGNPDGGFVVGVDDWGDIISVPAGAGIRRVETLHAPSLLRAAINTYATIPDFVVNGIYKEAPPSALWSRIFNEQYVYKPESGLIWDYSPKKFWPSSGTVDFYAYAPAGIKNLKKGLHDNGDDVNCPVLEYTMPYKEREEPPPGNGEPPSPLIVDDRQEDLLVAVQHRPSPQTDPVPLKFRHAFSRVTVKAKTYQDYPAYRIKVTRVDLRNIYTSGKLTLDPDNSNSTNSSNGIPMDTAAHFKYPDSGSITGSKVVLWTDAASAANYHFRLISGAVAIDNDYTSLLRNDDGVFVMPQTVSNNAEIYVEYNIFSLSPAGEEQYQSSAQKRIPFSAFTFEIGRQYELQVTLDAP